MSCNLNHADYGRRWDKLTRKFNQKYQVNSNSIISRLIIKSYPVFLECQNRYLYGLLLLHSCSEFGLEVIFTFEWRKWRWRRGQYNRCKEKYWPGNKNRQAITKDRPRELWYPRLGKPQGLWAHIFWPSLFEACLHDTISRIHLSFWSMEIFAERYNSSSATSLGVLIRLHTPELEGIRRLYTA